MSPPTPSATGKGTATHGLPVFLRFEVIEERLGIGRWLTERIISDAKVPTRKTPGGRGAILIERDAFLAAVAALPLVGPYKRARKPSAEPLRRRGRPITRREPVTGIAA